MDKIILGFLMMKSLTIYEIRNVIKMNLQGICSDSMGSIQAAIKKLLNSEMIVFHEFVENSVNKKAYSITPKGCTYFSEWISNPMSNSKMKNMELSKLFFMGLSPKEKRIELLDSSIAEMKEELICLTALHNSLSNIDDNINSSVNEFKADSTKSKILLDASHASSIEEGVTDIVNYTLLTLKFGLDMCEFQISWFENLREKILKGEDLL